MSLLYFLQPSNIVTATAGPKVLHNFKLMIVTSGSRTLVTTDKPRKRVIFSKSQQDTWLAGKVCSRWCEMWGRGWLDRGSARGPSSAIFTTISLYILLKFIFQGHTFVLKLNNGTNKRNLILRYYFPSFLSIEDYLQHQWTILFQFDLNIFATAEDLPHYLLSSDFYQTTSW